MASGLTLDIGANTREAVRGAKDIGEALEEVADSLDGIVREGADSGEGIERGMRDATKATEKVERSFKELANAAQRESKNAGDDIGRNVRDGTDRAKDGVSEVGDEAASTAKEAAASFDGSAESIGDAFQEVAANAFAGFGPAGLIAGVAAAAGLGLVTAEMQKQQEESDKLKERMSGLYTAAIEEGRDFVSQAQILAEAQDIIFNPERADEYLKLQADAKVLGLDINTIIRARAGDEEANNDVLARGKALLDEQAGQVASNDEAQIAANQRRFEELNGAIGQNKEIGKEIETNKQRVQDYNGLVRDGTERQRDANAATRDQGRAVDEVAAKISALPNAERTIKLRVDRSEYDGFVAGVKNGTISVPVSIRAAERGGRTP